MVVDCPLRYTLLMNDYWGFGDQRFHEEILRLPIAADWSKPFRERVAAARSWRSIELEAILATIEAVTRKLRTRGWKRRHTSNRKRDGHADSRYYRAPNTNYEIRISSHPHPTNFQGRQYIITRQILYGYNVLGLITMIERDLRNHVQEQ